MVNFVAIVVSYVGMFTFGLLVIILFEKISLLSFWVYSFAGAVFGLICSVFLWCLGIGHLRWLGILSLSSHATSCSVIFWFISMHGRKQDVRA